MDPPKSLASCTDTLSANDLPFSALETYHYAPLKPKESTFRLLKLFKYNGSELECEIFPQSLNEHTSYEALSYVWGSSELVECITLNRKQFWITDNLHAALQRLQLRDRDRYLWIDAICINQANKVEQGQQVKQMGVIFQQAEKVLFWLGKATLEIVNFMDALKQLQRLNANLDPGQWTLDDNLWEDHGTAIRKLLDRQWFTRVWILQEVANARKADVCCGNRTIPAEIFARVASRTTKGPAPHCQAVLEIMPGSLRSESWWTQPRDLGTLLRRFQASKATDERDKIYALLGLSSNLFDMQGINIDYQKPIHEVVNQTMTYLLQSKTVLVYEIFNLVNTFLKLDTIYFVPEYNLENATEIVFPSIQSGSKLNEDEQPKHVPGGIPVFNNPALFLFEKRPERDSEDQDTCYSQVVKLMSTQASKAEDLQSYGDGLEVIPWGNVEQHVKIVVIRDRKKAVLNAALQGYDQLVRQLPYHKRDARRIWHGEISPLYEAITLSIEPTKAAIRIQTRAIQIILLDPGTGVNAKEGKYGNALHAAAANCDEQIVELLLNAGADVNAEGKQFGSALQAAAFNCNERTVKLLLNAGANVNAKGGIYGNALQAAAREGIKEIVELLLNAGADVNAEGGTYGNALQAAVSRGNKQMVELLLNAGADVKDPIRMHGKVVQRLRTWVRRR